MKDKPPKTRLSDKDNNIALSKAGSSTRGPDISFAAPAPEFEWTALESS